MVFGLRLSIVNIGKTSLAKCHTYQTFSKREEVFSPANLYHTVTIGKLDSACCLVRGRERQFIKYIKFAAKNKMTDTRLKKSNDITCKVHTISEFCIRRITAKGARAHTVPTNNPMLLALMLPTSSWAHTGLQSRKNKCCQLAF